ncbi:LysR family transcriptional regulator [Roseibium marinum]|uniref:DNA-binding transcriptional LysR family regulator n=1 Tax=Roseibium marinum TaxID=281252 RepID=A0A2S3UT86_9HYPH|nr:LysR family transcriptional regulator [Roseibium marinum]POF30932.1 DNA-binding transcriptional LysR family regulator [Roseibium marinum]
MHLSLRTLQYIVATAETLSVTEASRRLNVSQPSISTAISAMETEIGVEIFVRHHARGVSLTPAGRQFANAARRLLKHADEFERNMRSLGDAMSGEITIGCFSTLATRFMPGLMSEFAKIAPGIEVSLREGDQEEIIRGLVSGEAELALAYGFALPPEISGERLAELPPYVMVSADHRLATRQRISLAEISEEPFILLDLPHSREYFFSLFALAGTEAQVLFRSRSYELIRGLVGHGHGYTIHNAVPGSSQAYDGSRIAVLGIEDAVPPVHVTSLRLERQTLRPAVEAFANFLRAAFAPGGIFDPVSISPRGIYPVADTPAGP